MLSHFSILIGSTLTIEAMFIEYIVVCNAHKFIDVENGPENKTVFKKVQFVIIQLDSLLSKDLLISHCVYTITIEQRTSGKRSTVKHRRIREVSILSNQPTKTHSVAKNHFFTSVL